MFKLTFKFTLKFTSAFLLEVITWVPFMLCEKIVVVYTSRCWHMGKDQRAGAFVYFGQMSSFLCVVCLLQSQNWSKCVIKAVLY